MKLSIIILNYNVRYFLELCLKSVQAAIKGIDAEIIVVDNNSTDTSCKMVKTLFPKVKLIENKDNYGFSKGNNIGVTASSGEYVCILNPDTVVAEDAFVKILEYADSKNNLGIVGCQLINGNGLFLPESKRNIPKVSVALKKILGYTKHYYANNLAAHDSGEVQILVGAFMVMKKSVFNKVGGFDETYFMYGEDIDLSYKILKAGFKNYYFGNTTTIHFKGESTLKDSFYAKRFYEAMQIFYKKHFKQNWLFDMVVWLGIKIAYTFRGTPKQKNRDIAEYVYISNKENKKLESTLTKKVILQKALGTVKQPSEIIFDANVISYKNIINTIAHHENKDQITFKILPNNSNFILGSNDGFTQGEIICLNMLLE